MNQEENREREFREERHSGSQRDIKDIKNQVDILSGVVGNMDQTVKEMVTAWQGNSFGTEGMVSQMRKVVEEQKKLNERLDDLEMANTKKQFYIYAFLTCLGIIVGTVLGKFIDHLTPIKK